MSRNFMAERVRSFGTSIFTEMSMLARQHGAVNLGQGFPDFDGISMRRVRANPNSAAQ